MNFSDLQDTGLGNVFTVQHSFESLGIDLQYMRASGGGGGLFRLEGGLGLLTGVWSH